MSALANVAVDQLTADEAVKLIDQAVMRVMKRWKFNHPFDDLTACEAAARRVHLCSKAAGTFAGAATGVGGLITVPADIAASLLIVSSTVHATASAFGYQDNAPIDQVIRLHTINLALSASKNQRQTQKMAIDNLLQRANIDADRQSNLALRQLALAIMPSLTDNLMSWTMVRLGGKAVPVVSAATGGYLGYRLQTLATKAALHVYRDRWKLDQRARRAIAGKNIEHTPI